MHKLFLVILFVSLEINAMQEKPKRNDVFSPFLVLPSELQDIIGSYLIEDDSSLRARLHEAHAPYVFSQDYRKILLIDNSDLESKIRRYDMFTCEFTRVASTPYFQVPLAISNCGRIWVVSKIIPSFNDPNRSTLIDIYLQNSSSTKQFLTSTVIRSCLNKQATKLAVLCDVPGQDTRVVRLFSRKLPKKDPNYPENLLGKYFRENRICRTLNKQNPNLSK